AARTPARWPPPTCTAAASAGWPDTRHEGHVCRMERTIGPRYLNSVRRSTKTSLIRGGHSHTGPHGSVPNDTRNQWMVVAGKGTRWAWFTVCQLENAILYLLSQS